MRNTILFFSTILFLAINGYAEPPSKQYKLAWADEFNGAALDTQKWGYRALGPRRDAVNVKDTVSLNGDGMLVLTTKKVGDEYHTAMIGTQGKFETTFGYFETRVKFQTQVGHWSAFWLQSPTMGQVGDPQKFGTEIDIYEYLRNQPETLHFNLHWDGYGDEHKTTGSDYKSDSLTQGFHVIGLEWTPNEYVFYVDGKERWRSNKAVSHRDEYIILSLEVGKWAGDIKQATLPDRCYFDYVRVYKKQSAAK
ncbi:family 16 glycosylhydrolase [bacterium]|nr:family 16 glycosylhydrolase [bacterium]